MLPCLCAGPRGYGNDASQYSDSEDGGAEAYVEQQLLQQLFFHALDESEQAMAQRAAALGKGHEVRVGEAGQGVTGLQWLELSRQAAQ